MILLFCRDLWDFISAVAGSIKWLKIMETLKNIKA
jgi:hypothetical protein